MRPLRGILPACLLGTLQAIGLSAEEPVWSVKVEVLMVSVQPSTSLTLLPKLQEEESAPAAILELWKLIEDGGAEVLGYPIALIGDGNRSVVETGEEVRYPTEAFGPIGPGNYVPDPNPPPPRMDWRSVYTSLALGPITPVEFETRSVGEKLEVEAAVEKGGSRIQLNVTAECVRVLRFQEFTGTTALNGVTGIDTQPDLATSKFSSSLIARNGEWQLLSSFIQPQPQPHVILFLLRAVSIPAGSEKPTK